MVSTYETSRRYNREEQHGHLPRREILISHTKNATMHHLLGQIYRIGYTVKTTYLF